MRPIPAVFALLLTVLCAPACAASFDCKAAAGKIETMICADPGVSQQDSQLAAAYAQLKKQTGDEKAETAVQLAWLKARNTCADRACVQRTYATRIAELQARSANTSPLVGFWKKEYACDPVTDFRADRCKEGDRDVFVLAIQVQGDHVCITHLATAQLGNRIDASDDMAMSMTGKASGNGATVAFTSSWGGTGTAVLRRDANVLRWQVRSHDAGESWIPPEETLTRMPAGQYDKLPACHA